MDSDDCDDKTPKGVRANLDNLTAQLNEYGKAQRAREAAMSNDIGHA